MTYITIFQSFMLLVAAVFWTKQGILNILCTLGMIAAACAPLLWLVR